MAAESSVESKILSNVTKWLRSCMSWCL